MAGYSGPPPTQVTTYPLDMQRNIGYIVPWQRMGPPVQQQTPYGQQMAMFNAQQGGLYNLGNVAVQQGQAYANLANSRADQLAALGGQIGNQFKYNDQYAQQALRDAFDPQKEAYKQALGDLTDQTRSGEAARGIAMTPYGASVEGQTLGRFANDWRTQQIERQFKGSQSASALQGQRLAAQMGGASLINDAGQLNLGAAKTLLESYGLQGSSMKAALDALVQMMGQQKISTESGGGGQGSMPHSAI